MTSAYPDLPLFPSIEKTVRNLIRAVLQLEDDQYDRVGRDLIGTLGDRPYYVRVIRAGGATDRFEGDFVLDIECFAPDYSLADSLAWALDARLLGYPHVVDVDGARVVVDEVNQNVAPNEIPWDDDEVSRILATYVFTIRR